MKKFIVDVVVISVIFVLFLYYLYPLTSCEIIDILLSPFYNLLYINHKCIDSSLRYLPFNKDSTNVAYSKNFRKMQSICGFLLLFIIIYNVIQIVLYQDLQLWLKIFLYTTMYLASFLFLIQILKYKLQTKNNVTSDKNVQPYGSFFS